MNVVVLIETIVLLLILGTLITQVIIPGFFPSVFGPHFFWLFRRSKQREMDALRQKLAEKEQELAAQKLRERLEREAAETEAPKHKSKKQPVDKKPKAPKSPPSTKSDDEPTSFAQ